MNDDQEEEVSISTSVLQLKTANARIKALQAEVANARRERDEALEQLQQVINDSSDLVEQYKRATHVHEHLIEPEALVQPSYETAAAGYGPDGACAGEDEKTQAVDVSTQTEETLHRTDENASDAQLLQHAQSLKEENVTLQEELASIRSAYQSLVETDQSKLSQIHSLQHKLSKRTEHVTVSGIGWCIERTLCHLTGELPVFEKHLSTALTLFNGASDIMLASKHSMHILSLQQEKHWRMFDSTSAPLRDKACMCSAGQLRVLFLGGQQSSDGTSIGHSAPTSAQPAILKPETNTVSHLNLVGEHANELAARVGASVASINTTQMVLVGGRSEHNEASVSSSPDVFFIDYARESVVKLNDLLTGNPPDVVEGIALCVGHDEETVVLHGGYSASGQLTSQLTILNLRRKHWSSPAVMVLGDNPGSRAGHTATFVGNGNRSDRYVLIAGGHNQDNAWLADAYVLDLQFGTWIKLLSNALRAFDDAAQTGMATTSTPLATTQQQQGERYALVAVSPQRLVRLQCTSSNHALDTCELLDIQVPDVALAPRQVYIGIKAEAAVGDVRSIRVSWNCYTSTEPRHFKLYVSKAATPALVREVYSGTDTAVTVTNLRLDKYTFRVCATLEDDVVLWSDVTTFDLNSRQRQADAYQIQQETKSPRTPRIPKPKLDTPRGNITDDLNKVVERKHPYNTIVPPERPGLV